jgi:hypothetical protein
VPRTSEMVQSKYLKTADVPDPVIVTVTKVGRVNMAKEDAAPEYKWAIRFQEFDKPMVLEQHQHQDRREGLRLGQHRRLGRQGNRPLHGRQRDLRRRARRRPALQGPGEGAAEGPAQDIRRFAQRIYTAGRLLRGLLRD